MSHQSYDKLWHETQALLKTAIDNEIPQLDRRMHRPQLAELYIRYIIIANQLSECVDQIVQPQKHKYIRRLLEIILGRVLELKDDLIESDLCEYTHCGDTLDKLKISPNHAELKVPNCFKHERREELTARKLSMDDILEKLGYLDQPKEMKKMSELEAILLIQGHERARQGRLRAQFMKEIRLLKDKSKPPVAEEPEEDSGKIDFMAAVCIQKIWRGYTTRRITRRKKLQEMMLIGMLPSPKPQSKTIEAAEQIWLERQKLQDIRRKDYEEAIEKNRNKLQKKQRGPLLEQIGDQVRGWLYEYKEHTGKIPEYTGSERSASRMMLSRQGTDSEISKSTGTEKSSKDSKGKKSKSDKSKDGKANGDEDEDMDTKATVSVFLPEITLKNEEYEDTWREKDESANPRQYHYDSMIMKQQMNDLESELRKVVDEMMRTELQMLQEAMDRDRGTKGKKQKKASKKSRRGGKKSKKKKEKDLTPDRTTESLFEELVANGIIRKYPETYLKDFVGEKSHCNAVPHNKGKEVPIAMGDLRQLVTENCILPLSSPLLRESTPLVRSLLIAGARGSGKDMLVHAICTEAGALLFDLSPANIVGKYPGKSGLTMLLHLVSKVSRLLQPAVIYMDSAEKPFMKKTAKGDKTDPKRLKKDLPKLVKGELRADRFGEAATNQGETSRIRLRVNYTIINRGAAVTEPSSSLVTLRVNKAPFARKFVNKVHETCMLSDKITFRLKIEINETQGIFPEDRIMMIGVSHCPWESDQKLLQQVYQKYLLIPKPDYAARYAMWRHLLGQYKAIGYQFDVSAMSKISDGYTLGSIASCVEEVMTCKRMLQLRVQPLNPAELINVLCTRTAIYREEEEAMLLWWNKTPLVRRRQKAIELLLAEERELMEPED